MSDPGSDGPSFDPRSWRGAKPGESNPNAGDPTFDPKSWRKPKRAEARRKSSSGPWILIGLALVAVIGVVAAIALWPRARPTPRPVQVVTVRAVQAPVVPGAQRRSLTLTGPQELLGALTSAGVADTDAQAAVQAAQVQLGAGAGGLRITLTLLPAVQGLQAGQGVVLSRLEARRDSGAGAIVTRQPDGRYMAAAASADLVTQVMVVRGQMDTNSFYSSAVAAGVRRIEAVTGAAAEALVLAAGSPARAHFADRHRSLRV